jgi:hypothetical protein
LRTENRRDGERGGASSFEESAAGNRHRLILGWGMAGCACEALIELFVIPNRVDVYRRARKIERRDIVSPLENNSFGSVITFEPQQIGK